MNLVLQRVVRPSSGLDFRPLLRAGDTVAWPQAIGEPLGLTSRLVAQAEELPPIRLFFGMSSSDTLRPALADRFGLLALNGAGSNRRLAGRADVLPVHASSLPSLLRSRRIAVDVVLIRVRPMPDGRYSLGVIADYTQAMIAAARVVVAEIDDRLPLTGGDAVIAASAVHHLLVCDAPEILLPDPEPSATETAVAARVAARIPDGATIQLGIGGLPTAVVRALSQHRDLGIHSGIIPDGVADLLERGVVTNALKGLDAGHTVTGGLFGARRLLDLADGNRAILLRSVEHTHALSVMARLHALHAVNSAIEVDLSGQVNAEVAAGRYLGAVGGQLDFVRGAQLSPGGRSIIALPSTTADGRQSRIVADLAGRPVTTPRSDTDLVITEHGVAELQGCSLAERARRLITIAAPAFRDELEAAARAGGAA